MRKLFPAEGAPEDPSAQLTLPTPLEHDALVVLLMLTHSATPRPLSQIPVVAKVVVQVSAEWQSWPPSVSWGMNTWIPCP